jgi:FAD/FMN-containing dehydrogenase
VLASGEIWNGLRALRKDNTGYDLKQLFIGSEGTLGIITAATLKLFPLPRAQVTAFAALPSLAAAAKLLELARAGAGPGLTAFEVMSAGCLRRTVSELPRLRAPLPLTAPWYVLLEISDHADEAHAARVLESILSSAFEAGTVEDSVVAASLEQSHALWQIREGIPEAHAKAGGNVKHDIALPVSSIPAFVEETNARLAARFPWIEPAVFGHLGDGNLHYNMGAQAGTPIAVAFEHEREINAIVHAAVAARGGSISAEHGIGQLKREVLPDYKSPLELTLMRQIKQTLDPAGLMNPGKLL